MSNDCRNCGYCHHHIVNSDLVCHHDTRLGWLANLQPCNCKEFVPLDNLEYLEYIVNKGGK